MPRILIVEDSLDSVHTLAYLLRHSGHDVAYAINGYSALEIAKHHRPDVVLLDIGLPDFDGCELAKHLKRLPGLEAMRIIAITGRVCDDEQRALAAGCERFLRKPVAFEVLETALNAAAYPQASVLTGTADPRRLN